MTDKKTQMTERRQSLLTTMQLKYDAGITCTNCSGLCCSFVANSMQITPLEAKELWTFLKQQKRWNKHLKETLQQTINDYGLDKPMPGDGKRVFSRRTYTCPFYQEGPLGCSISPKAKPYGCLAFNPTRKGASEGKGCASDQIALRHREDQFKEKEHRLNQKLKTDLDLFWDKVNIPEALLEVGSKLESDTK